MFTLLEKTRIVIQLAKSISNALVNSYLYTLDLTWCESEQMVKGHKSDDEGEGLYDQDSHVSKAILSGVEPGSYRCINTNPDKKLCVLIDKQKEHVRNVGLSHLSEIDYMRIDHALISELVERRRLETNIFHLPTGEAMNTLKDVAYIYGLPIDGESVTRRTFNYALVPEVWKELLGLTPSPGHHWHYHKVQMVGGEFQAL